MPVCPRIILRPASPAFAPVHGTVTIARKQRIGMLRIHQPALDPFSFLLPVRRHRNVIVRLHTGIDAEGTLERVQRSEQGNSTAQPPKRATENHLSSCPEDSIDS